MAVAQLHLGHHLQLSTYAYGTWCMKTRHLHMGRTGVCVRVVCCGVCGGIPASGVDEWSECGEGAETTLVASIHRRPPSAASACDSLASWGRATERPCCTPKPPPLLPPSPITPTPPPLSSLSLGRLYFWCSVVRPATPGSAKKRMQRANTKRHAPRSALHMLSPCCVLVAAPARV